MKIVPDGHCVAQVALRGLNFHRTRPCCRPGKIEIDGSWFCGIHDPTKKTTRERIKSQYASLRTRSNELYRAAEQLREEVLDGVRAGALDVPDAQRRLTEAEATLDASREDCVRFYNTHPELWRRGESRMKRWLANADAEDWRTR